MKIKSVLLTVVSVFIGLAGSSVSPAQAPGDLDITFGPSNTGEVILVPPLANAPNHYKSVLQSDGKIVSLLGENDGSNPVANMLVRLNIDGSVDTSFGTDGYVYMTIGGGGNGRFITLGKQLISGEERFVVAGWSPCGRKSCFRAERYTTDGTLDLTFGNSGVTSLSTSWPGGIAIQQDQKILLVGSSGVVRLLQNGAVDNTFGTSGISTAAGIGVIGITVAADGKILLSGKLPRGKSGDFAVARLNSNGSLDDGSSRDSTPGDSFGTLGVASVDFNRYNEEACAVAIDGSGRIVLAGQAQIGGSAIANFDAALARFSPSGVLDTTFGTQGKVIVNLAGRQDLFKAIALQDDGKIVVTGEGRPVAGLSADVLTARFNSDGSFDLNFGNGGMVTYGGADTYEQAQSILIQADPYCGPCSKLVIAGASINPLPTNTPSSIVLRYWL